MFSLAQILLNMNILIEHILFRLLLTSRFFKIATFDIAFSTTTSDTI